jgi:hypothetical protein
MKWRWMEGMKDTNGTIVTYVAGDGYVEGYNGQMVLMDDDCVPDWADPATIGCLLAQVREGYPRAWTMYVDDKWYVMTIVADEWTTISARKTEADALLAALEISDWPH